ncbi:MAG TPA: serine hydrolase domain-containing protein [Dermatophilaceae bacterium]|nr:serine hydrolase domain-containing protein [Dermatophilaceae bacterium]
MGEAGAGQWTPVRRVLADHVERGSIPGAVAGIFHAGRSHVFAVGGMTFGGRALPSNAIIRIASLTKPIAAAATLTLVQEGTLDLDAPVATWLPELAAPRVLTHPTSELDTATPARRPILVRHLLTMTMGTGAFFAAPGSYPLQRALEAAGLAPGPDPSPLDQDTWLARLAALPLAHEPGAGFMYHTSYEVLGILLSRVAGHCLEQVLTERILGPLGMRDTRFWVRPPDRDRLPTLYATDEHGWGLIAYDTPAASRWARPPGLQSAGHGLVSTAADYLAFGRMLAREGDGLLTAQSVRLMATDALTPEQREAARPFFGRSSTWGLGVEINLRRAYPWMTPGRFGWSGGTGTAAYVDPARDVVAVLLTQRLMDDPQPPGVAIDFWRALYEALDVPPAER